MSEKDLEDILVRKNQPQPGNFGHEQGKNVFQKRSLGANGIGSATLCGSQNLTQPSRP